MEDYITFDTAILAKEKGYTELTDMFYNIKEEDIVHHGYTNNILLSDIRISAPTQYELQQWLRDNYKIHVTPRPASVGQHDTIMWNFDVYTITDKGTFKVHVGNMLTEKYEESLEVGLRFALNLIKN